MKIKTKRGFSPRPDDGIMPIMRNAAYIRKFHMLENIILEVYYYENISFSDNNNHEGI